MQRMLTDGSVNKVLELISEAKYAEAYAHVCSRMLAYADVC